jgi:DNA replication protein DnaC
MLHQPTIEKLLAMHLEPMVETWRNFEQNEDAAQLSFDEKLSLMVDRLWTWRQNLALQRRLRYAKLKGNACVEDIDYRASRGLDRTLIRSLVNDSSWVSRHENIFLVGPTGGRQELARWRFGSEELSRRISRALHPRRCAVPRSNRGTR